MWHVSEDTCGRIASDVRKHLTFGDCAPTENAIINIFLPKNDFVTLAHKSVALLKSDPSSVDLRPVNRNDACVLALGWRPLVFASF